MENRKSPQNKLACSIVNDGKIRFFESRMMLSKNPCLFGFSPFMTLYNSFLAWERSLMRARLMQMHCSSFVFPLSLRRWGTGGPSGADLPCLS